MTATIRRLTKADCDKPFVTGVKEFDEKPSGEPYTLLDYYKRDQNEGYQTYVQEVDSKIIGIVSFHIRDFTNRQKMIYLSRIGIHEEEWDKDYGSDLFEFLISTCISQGIRILSCEVMDDVAGFFTGLGWEIVDEYDDPFWGAKCKTLLLKL